MKKGELIHKMSLWKKQVLLYTIIGLTVRLKKLNIMMSFIAQMVGILNLMIQENSYPKSTMLEDWQEKNSN